MPPTPNASENRLKNIVAYLKLAVALVDEAARAFEAPFLASITTTTLALISSIQNMTKHQEESVELLEDIHGILYGIVNLHIESETPGSLPPATLEHIGRFTQTLRKISTLIKSQQEGNRIKQLFRQGELSKLRKECRSGLQEALAVFKFAGSTAVLTNIDKMKEATDRMHAELLELISGASDAPSSDGSSFTYQTNFQSSNSFSLLPGKPKLFYGREREVEDIMQVLSQPSPRIAILGGGGMGKTALAQTILHDRDIIRRYGQRFFVTADSTSNSVELASHIGSHLGLGPGPDLTKAVVAHLATGPPSLLILDNLETPWESLESRAKVEEFLSLLADVEHFALVITMRGAERPAKVRWTRPFLAPLESLSDAATREIFMEITDSTYDGPDVDELLRLTDNMPLAVDLIAHLVDYEGCATVLKRWQTEKTSLLSQGWDRKSSLAASITISLTSPRLESSPGARDLLALLSLLPDGLSDAQLVQSKLPIQGILSCKVALLATSLAYQDSQKRIKSLALIRDHIQQWSPPSFNLILALIRHYHSQLGLFQRYYGTQDMGSIINQATLNRGNLHQLLRWALRPENPDREDALQCALWFNRCTAMGGQDATTLLDSLPAAFPQPCDHPLEARYAVEVFRSMQNRQVNDPDELIEHAVSHFKHFSDPILESEFYNAVGQFYRFRKNDSSASLDFFKMALSLSKSHGDLQGQSTALRNIAEVQCNTGHHSSALPHAKEAQRLARLSSNLYNEALALRIGGVCCRELGDYQAAINQLDKVQEIMELCSIPGGRLQLIALGEHARVHLLKSEYREAKDLFNKLKRTISVEGQPTVYVSTLLQLAELDLLIGTPEPNVRDYLRTAKVLSETLNIPQAQRNCDAIEAELYLLQGNQSRAKFLFVQCINAMRRVDNRLVSYCLQRLADTTRWETEDFESMSTWPVVYLAHGQKHQEKMALYHGLMSLGDVCLSRGEDDSAHSLFSVALQGFTDLDIHHGRAKCMNQLGDLANSQGETVTSIELWKAARPLFERCLQTRNVARINAKLLAVEKGQKSGRD
ncbi:hypothetical protein B0H16DRAFT_863026 [Mycena metata]|uniref:Novel STAND NTPase 1 domain-containing protein n=1 Tax=Mycena metata TaxID=1033252 RepID=A0AAD7IT49_9AGAR|nr:hypothetical protein B0H16DRAFT_863026 [Mycena metata]